MPIGWKYTRADGTDHFSGTVNYKAAIGKTLKHPCPDLESKAACGEGYHLGKTLRGAGEYGAPNAIFKCEYSRRDVLGEDQYKVRVSELKVLAEVERWRGFGRRGKQVLAFIDSLSTIPWFANAGKPYKKPQWAKELEQVDSWDAARAAAGAAAWPAAGDAAWAAAWDAAGAAARDAARDAARAAARDAARAAAWAAAWPAAGDAAWAAAWDAARDAAGAAAGAAYELMASTHKEYFLRLVEVYRAGHYPCSWDGKKLIVY